MEWNGNELPPTLVTAIVPNPKIRPKRGSIMKMLSIFCKGIRDNFGHGECGLRMPKGRSGICTFCGAWLNLIAVFSQCGTASSRRPTRSMRTLDGYEIPKAKERGDLHALRSASS